MPGSKTSRKSGSKTSKKRKSSGSKTTKKRATSAQSAARKKFAVNVKKVSKLMKGGLTKKQAWAKVKK
jgi:hypothetical protein